MIQNWLEYWFSVWSAVLESYNCKVISEQEGFDMYKNLAVNFISW